MSAATAGAIAAAVAASSVYNSNIDYGTSSCRTVGPQVFLWAFLALHGLTFIAGMIGGSVDAEYHYVKSRSRWRYFFPLFRVGYEVGFWMNRGEKKKEDARW